MVVLDLTMPISDGYETCKNIVNLYADSDKILRFQKSPSSYDLNQADIENSRCHNLRSRDLTPLLIACTSSILDDSLMKKLQAHGFRGAHEAPIHDSEIKNEIIPKLFERKHQLDKKESIMKQIKESLDEVFKSNISHSSKRSHL